jgi:aminoglycoside phosphotransferase (APT) family kinase protein
VTKGQWRPVPAGAGGNAPPEADAVIRALTQVLEAPPGHDWHLSIERMRLAGRSNMYIVRAETPVGSSRRWVVKQPHTGWTQDDVGSPLTAMEEFSALERLHVHFEHLDIPLRVPTPVAYLPELDAFAMEYVAGVTIKDLLSYRSVLRPAPLFEGLTSAGTFLRHLHTLEQLPTVEVDLRQEAEMVLSVEAEKLHPLGLSLPGRVRRTMAELPSVKVTSAQVWLHGDFGPANILLEGNGSAVGLDAALQTVGVPEDDLVRFVALVSGVIRLAPEIVVPPVRMARHELENRLLRSYYQTATRPPLFELRYLHQLARRWCRLRELAQQHAQNALLAARLRVIGQQVRLLMKDSERRLVSSLGG